MAYEAFAEVYEELMDNVPYDAWCHRILQLLRGEGITDGLVTDLGCGTGSMTRRLAKAGYDMIGIDLSPDMLDVARETEAEQQEDEIRETEQREDVLQETGQQEDEIRETEQQEDEPQETPQGTEQQEDVLQETEQREDVLQETEQQEDEIQGAEPQETPLGTEQQEDELRETEQQEAEEQGPASPILYLNQDMRSFELYGTVRAIVCVCDSINYITDATEVQEVFRLVNNYLDPGGLLVLDFHTPRYYHDTLGEDSIAETREDMAMIWENEESEDGLHRLFLTVFRETEDGMYERFDEVHEQRGYTPEEMKLLAEAAGLKSVHFYDGYTEAPATKDSERIVMTARENGKG